MIRKRKKCWGHFDSLKYEINRQTLISVVRDKVGQFETGQYNQILSSICQQGGAEVEYVSVNELKVSSDLPYLANKADIEHYLDALRQVLLKAIQQNKRIRF